MQFHDAKMPRGAAHGAYTGGRRPWIDNSLLLSPIEFPHQLLVSLTEVMRNS